VTHGIGCKERGWGEGGKLVKGKGVVGKGRSQKRRAPGLMLKQTSERKSSGFVQGAGAAKNQSRELRQKNRKKLEEGCRGDKSGGGDT